MSGFRSETGIAIGPILFIIALLAIIATAIAAGSSSFSSGSDQEKARTYAGAILDYAASLRHAVQRVMANGCTENQISFENPVASGYTNAAAPADKHCHIFDIAGGGMLWYNFTNQIPSLTTSLGISSSVRIQNLGSGNAALVMFFGTSAADTLLINTCLAINDLLKIPNNAGAAPIDNWTSGNSPYSPFAGSYNDSTPSVIGDNYAPLAGKMGGCLSTSGTASIWPFFVLLVR